MHQLRIYTLRTAEALEDYATARWPRHIHSLRVFDVSNIVNVEELLLDPTAASPLS